MPVLNKGRKIIAKSHSFALNSSYTISRESMKNLTHSLSLTRRLNNMKKVMALIKKDIDFYKGMYGIILVIMTGLIYISSLDIDKNHATSTLNFLVYTCLVTICIVPYTYNIEDNRSTRQFILELPVSFRYIITAKYIFNIMSSAFFSFWAFGTYILLNQVILYRCLLIPILFSSIMNATFILFFYKLDLNFARLFLISPIVLFAIWAKRIENINITGSVFGNEFILSASIITVVFSIILGEITIRLNKK